MILSLWRWLRTAVVEVDRAVVVELCSEAVTALSITACAVVVARCDVVVDAGSASVLATVVDIAAVTTLVDEADVGRLAMV